METEMEVLAKVANAIVQTVAEVDADGMGAPEVAIHLAFQAHGIPSRMVKVMIDSLVEMGKLKRLNHQLFSVRDGVAKA